MVVHRIPALSDDEVDRLFRALADATRRDILRRTIVEDSSISALAARYDMSFAAVQKHIAVLEDAGLVTKHRRGRERLVRGETAAIEHAHTLLEQLGAAWRARAERLDALLAEDAPD